MGRCCAPVAWLRCSCCSGWQDQAQCWPRLQPPDGMCFFPDRLVLPYVRHLKGEDDKPLPPTKPRKQYKVSKEPRTKKEKSRQQVQWLGGEKLTRAHPQGPLQDHPMHGALGSGCQENTRGSREKEQLAASLGWESGGPRGRISPMPQSLWL